MSCESEHMAANYFLLFWQFTEHFYPLFQSALTPLPHPSASAWSRIERSAARLPTNSPWPCWNVRPTSMNWSGRRRPSACSRRYVRKVSKKSRPFVRKVTRLLYIVGNCCRNWQFCSSPPPVTIVPLLCTRTSRLRIWLRLQQRQHHHSNFNSDCHRHRDSNNDQQQP